MLDARTNAVKSQQEVERLRSEGSKAKDSGPSLEQLQNLERELEQYRQLRVNPKDLAMFRKNKGAIKEYLKLVPTLVEYAEILALTCSQR